MARCGMWPGASGSRAGARAGARQVLLGGAAVVLDRRRRGLRGWPAVENFGAVPRLASGAPTLCACSNRPYKRADGFGNAADSLRIFIFESRFCLIWCRLHVSSISSNLVE